MSHLHFNKCGHTVLYYQDYKELISTKFLNLLANTEKLPHIPHNLQFYHYSSKVSSKKHLKFIKLSKRSMCTMIVNVHAAGIEIKKSQKSSICEYVSVCMCLVVDAQEYLHKKKIFALPIYKYTVRNNPITIRSFGGSFNPGNQHWSNIPIWYHLVVFLFFSSFFFTALSHDLFGNYFKHIFVRYVMQVFPGNNTINKFDFISLNIGYTLRLSKRLMGE